ncbi:LOW QUALITY PROTEIN: aquaporin-10 [Morus bassanus]
MGTTSFLKRAQALLRIRSHLAQECLARLLAVVTLIVSRAHGWTCRAGADYPLGPSAPSPSPSLDAGAHLNPAFSLAMCLLEQFPGWKFPIFVAMQTLGAFIFAGAIHALCYDTIWHCSNRTLDACSPWKTTSIFATYPTDYLSLSNSFLDQAMGTALLIIGILANLDTRTKGVPKGLEPVATALLMLSIAMAVGFNCSCPMNPTQAFGPWHMVGWDTEVFSRGNRWWWVPMVAPLLGAAVGSALFQLLLAFHHPAEKGNPPAEESSLDLASAAIPPDTEMSSREDAGRTLPQKWGHRGRPAT